GGPAGRTTAGPAAGRRRPRLVVGPDPRLRPRPRRGRRGHPARLGGRADQARDPRRLLGAPVPVGEGRLGHRGDRGGRPRRAAGPLPRSRPHPPPPPPPPPPHARPSLP